VVSNVEYFKEKLRLWGEDPCSVEREEWRWRDNW
jgi:hypothetical protein